MQEKLRKEKERLEELKRVQDKTEQERRNEYEKAFEIQKKIEQENYEKLMKSTILAQVNERVKKEEDRIRKEERELVAKEQAAKAKLESTKKALADSEKQEAQAEQDLKKEEVAKPAVIKVAQKTTGLSADDFGDDDQAVQTKESSNLKNMQFSTATLKQKSKSKVQMKQRGQLSAKDLWNTSDDQEPKSLDNSGPAPEPVAERVDMASGHELSHADHPENDKDAPAPGDSTNPTNANKTASFASNTTQTKNKEELEPKHGLTVREVIKTWNKPEAAAPKEVEAKKPEEPKKVQ